MLGIPRRFSHFVGRSGDKVAHLRHERQPALRCALNRQRHEHVACRGWAASYSL